MADSVSSTIAKLEEARQVVLSDPTHYSAIIPGIVPIVGAGAQLEVRRWGSEFLAEAFASPCMGLQQKENLSVQVLQTLKDLLDAPNQDEYVLRAVVQAAASIYSLIFRHTTHNPQDAHTWGLMSSIKSSILKMFDSASLGVRVSSIKFILRVVQVQTPGLKLDPRKPEQNEISLAQVSRDHPLIPPSNLEAEASGLLDRVLAVFYEDSSDVILIDATLNALALIARTRQSVSNKIVTAIINFNPFKYMKVGMSPKERVRVQSMERTTCAFLTSFAKLVPNSPLAGRIAGQIQRLRADRLRFFSPDSRKRGHPVEPSEAVDNSKRIRLSDVPPLPPGPVSVAQLYTLTDDAALKGFDVMPVPIDLVVQIVVPVLRNIDAGVLDSAINAIRSRYLQLSRQQQSSQQRAGEDDDDDYEPEFEPHEDSEQLTNKMEPVPFESVRDDADLALGPFKLAQPPPLSQDEAAQLGKGAIGRVFGMMESLQPMDKPLKIGLNRLAGSNNDRDAWITLLTRLATRASPDAEPDAETSVALQSHRYTLGEGIRDMLWKYIVEDFRQRIDIAIAWLNEEWYNDRLRLKEAPNTPQHYEQWVIKLLDAMLPYLDANDKVLVRFLSELPEISQAVLDRVKGMARDPDRTTLAVKSIYYLVAFKPPVKTAAIDALEDLWRNFPDAKASVRPLLERVRPEALREPTANGVKDDLKAGSDAVAA